MSWRHWNIVLIITNEISFQRCPKIWYHCIHFEQYSSAMLHFCDVTRRICSWLLTSLVTTTLSYGYSWAVLYWARHVRNPENGSSGDYQVSCRFFCFLPIWTDWCHINTAWLPSTLSKWRPPKSNFGLSVKWISLETETSVSGKFWYLLAIAGDKKVTFLEWPRKFKFPEIRLRKI